MEQNRLRELILSMRRSKHNMINKAADFAQAIEDKGTVDMDTHELANIMKDAFTKRRKKEIYADLLSGIIGEPSILVERPVFASMSFNMKTQESGGFIFRLGDPAEFDAEGVVAPYISVMTVEQAQKISTSSSHAAMERYAQALTPSSENFAKAEEFKDSSIEEIMEMFGVNEETARSIMQDGCYQIPTYLLGNITVPNFVQTAKEGGGIPADEHLYITITYDGVDYTYYDDGSVTITPSSTTPAQPSEQPAAETPTFRSVISTDGVFTQSTYTLGNPITCDISNQQLPIDPYVIFLTDEEAQKFSVSIETNITGERADQLNESLEVFDIPDGNSKLAAFKGSCTKMFHGYVLGSLNDLGLEQNEYIRVVITYDGVDYVYST